MGKGNIPPSVSKKRSWWQRECTCIPVLHNIVLSICLPKDISSIKTFDDLYYDENLRQRQRWDLWKQHRATKFNADLLNVGRWLRNSHSNTVERNIRSFVDGAGEHLGRNVSFSRKIKLEQPRHIVYQGKRKLKLKNKQELVGIFSERKKRGKNFFCFDRKFWSVIFPRWPVERVISYTVFPSSGHVIITGLKKQNYISAAIRDCADLFGLSVQKLKKEGSIKVANTTWAGNLNCFFHPPPPPSRERTEWERNYDPKIHLMKIMSEYSRRNQKNPNLNLMLRSTFFPGVKLSHQNLRGTINLFPSGKYVMVGINSKTNVNRLHRWLCAIIRKYWMMEEREILCAANVDSFCPVSLEKEEDREPSGDGMRNL